MLTIFGYLTLALAFLVALYGLIAVIWGLANKSPAFVESARLAAIWIFPLLTFSIVTLVILLLTSRFDVVFVHSVTSLEMPGYLKLTALWGGQSGSLLFWSWLMAGFSALFFLRNWQAERDLLPWALLTILLTLGFFLGLNLFMEIPFERYWHLPDGSRIAAVFSPPGAWPLTPGNGQGLNPLLRHPGMIWHPPTLYLGFVGFIVPFSLAIAAMVSGQVDRRWIRIARPWTLATWVFLSLGLVLGMRWAYDILGWGGYWGWDPVEIAALMPWLSATALLHTTILQERRDGFKRWNLTLSVVTFILVTFGTFITRSGVLSSVHSFAESDIGLPMFAYLSLVVLGSVCLLIYRWEVIRPAYEPDFAFSKEVLTIFTNLVLLSILMVCFLGVIYPIVSELLTDTQVTVGPAWYKQITGPLFALLLLFLGICPLAAWGVTSLKKISRRIIILGPISMVVPAAAWLLGGVETLLTLIALWLAGLAVLVILDEYLRGFQAYWQRHPDNRWAAFWAPFWRSRRRYGGLMIHLGIVMIGIGIIGIEGLQRETQVRLEVGESIQLDGYAFRFDGVDHYESGDGRSVTEAVLAVTREGEPLGALYPRRDVFLTIGMAITQPGIHSNLGRDLYAILIDWRPLTQNEATFRIFINPLINWLWIGVGVLTLGAVLAGWPGRQKKLDRNA